MTRLAVLALLSLSLLSGCEHNDAGGSTAPPATAPAPVAVERKMKIAGEERRYLLHRPGPGLSGPRPLVILLHGTSDSAEYALAAYNFVERADKEGFLLVAPDGLASTRSWRALDAKPNPDLEFLSAMLDELIEQEQADPKRIYFAGHSAGGAMAYRFAAEHADRVAAVGVVAGLIKKGDSPDFPTPSRPMPVIAFHGENDPNLKFEEYGLPAAKWWAQQNHCRDVPKTEVTVDGVTRWQFYNGSAIVILYSIPNGNHMWPGGVLMPGKNQVPAKWPDATDFMWDFFKGIARYPQPQTAPAQTAP